MLTMNVIEPSRDVNVSIIIAMTSGYLESVLRAERPGPEHLQHYNSLTWSQSLMASPSIVTMLPGMITLTMTTTLMMYRK